MGAVDDLFGFLLTDVIASAAFLNIGIPFLSRKFQCMYVILKVEKSKDSKPSSLSYTYFSLKDVIMYLIRSRCSLQLTLM